MAILFSELYQTSIQRLNVFYSNMGVWLYVRVSILKYIFIRGANFENIWNNFYIHEAYFENIVIHRLITFSNLSCCIPQTVCEDISLNQIWPNFSADLRIFAEKCIFRRLTVNWKTCQKNLKHGTQQWKLFINVSGWFSKIFSLDYWYFTLDAFFQF